MLINAPIRSVAGDLDRRWMSDERFDLIVWYQPGGQVHGFQLCYDKPRGERALTWTRDGGFQHTAVDDGESRPTANRTPILVAAGVFPSRRIQAEFLVHAASLPVEIRDLVLARLDEYHHRPTRALPP